MHCVQLGLSYEHVSIIFLSNENMLFYSCYFSAKCDLLASEISFMTCDDDGNIGRHITGYQQQVVILVLASPECFDSTFGWA